MFAKEENQNSAAHHTDTSRPRVRIRRSSEYLATSIPIAALEAQRGFATSAEEREVLMLELETPGTGQCCEEITFDFHLRLATVHPCRAEGPDRDAVTGRREIAEKPIAARIALHFATGFEGDVAAGLAIRRPLRPGKRACGGRKNTSRNRNQCGGGQVFQSV